MNVADICVHHPAELHRVGIRYESRTRVMFDAVRIYRQLGVACDVDDTSISVEVPKAAATFFQGMLEYFTGRPGFNEWDPLKHRPW